MFQCANHLIVLPFDFIQICKLFIFKVTKRTRTYVVDGVEVTSTTMHVLGEKQDLELRKKELRDLKRIQREEARQQQELNARAEQIREQQERKFAFEMQVVLFYDMFILTLIFRQYKNLMKVKLKQYLRRKKRKWKNKKNNKKRRCVIWLSELELIRFGIFVFEKHFVLRKEI